VCHEEFTEMLGIIESIADIRIADYAHKVASACGSIQLDAKTTMLVLLALADIANSGNFQSGWPVWCDSNFSEVALAAALTLPTDDALVKLAEEAHRPTIRIPAFPGISDAAKELIEETLDDARWTTMQGKRWAPLVQFIHPGGVQSMRIRGMTGAEEEKRLVAQRIEESRKSLNASLVIMISDAWVGAPGDKVRPSSSPNRTEALTVAAWGADKVSTLGSLAYTRSLDGTVLFEAFRWSASELDRNKFAM
jgi:roadblock/LC7 domain-containing protein